MYKISTGLKVCRPCIYALMAGALFASCSKENTLAMNLDGYWTGSTVEVSASGRGADDGLGLAPGVGLKCTPSFTFIKDENADGGRLTMAASLVFQSTDGSSTSIPASVTANGSWSTLSADEVVVTFNPNEISVAMDPAVQSMPYSTVTGASREQLDSATVTELKHQQPLTEVVKHLVRSINTIKHIKIDNQDMTAEINDIDLEFKR